MKHPGQFSEAALISVLAPLGDYLKELVVCGSWVPLIYRNWVLKNPGEGITVRTLDVDLAVRTKLPVLGRPLVEKLRAAKYKVRRIPERPLWDAEGGDELRVTRFELPGAPFLELITPHIGPGPVGTVREVQAGVGAPELGYVEILLDHTREVPIPKTSLTVRVPTPAAYAFQKGLTFVERKHADKRGKDLANLFDMLHNFPEFENELREGVQSFRPRHGEAAWTAFRTNLERAFSSAATDDVRLVEEQRPQPYQDLVLEDPANGPARFRELIYARFSRFLEETGE